MLSIEANLRAATSATIHESKGGQEMGKGDQRTKRGKIWKGTYGKTRPRKKNKKESGK
jgi:30S ribosomal protein S31